MKTKLNLQAIFFSFALIYILILFNLQSGNAQMFWNFAGRFTGNTNSIVSIPNSTSLNITGSFSIQFWMNPNSIAGPQTLVAKSNTAASNRYGMQITNSRVGILTNNIVRAESAPFTLFEWTHITGTYNSATHQFRIYINGVLDTSRTDIGAQPASSTDTVYIGSLPTSSSFSGKIDEVRIWNKALSETEVSQFFRTSLSATGGVYTGLVLSLPFQGHSSADGFDLNDQSGNGNNGTAKGNILTYHFNQTKRPNQTITPNESVELDGNDDYLAAADHTSLSPTGGVTLECWVYPRNSNACVFLTKGNDYRLSYSGTAVTFTINSNLFSTGAVLPRNQWSHLALTYLASNGVYSFYLNGILRSTSTIAVGNINNGTDSLYIGGAPGFIDFNGFIDEVRISNSIRSLKEINQFLYQSIDAANQLTSDVYFNLDGSVTSSGEFSSRLFFRNNARLSHPGCIANQPVSPLNRNDTSFFSKGYYMVKANKRIPETGSSGITIDSTVINFNVNSLETNLFIALNHSKSSNLDITLVGPDGDSVKVFNNNVTNSLDNNLITIFNDQADSSLINNKYSSFSPVIKPANNLNSVFSGSGTWKLIIRDEAANDTGFLYAWGIQLENVPQRFKDLDLTALIQGFYNPATNLMLPDNITVNLHKAVPPYQSVSGSFQSLNNAGFGLFGFFLTPVNDNGQPYLLRLEHRNSIETWSHPFSFVLDEATYSFVDSAGAAFGSNQIQVDTSPVRFAIYGGDVNQDGVVDATDAGAIDNDAFNFITGYVDTDITGDDVVDASDASIADNNAFNFVTKITP